MRQLLGEMHEIYQQSSIHKRSRTDSPRPRSTERYEKARDSHRVSKLRKGKIQQFNLDKSNQFCAYFTLKMRSKILSSDLVKPKLICFGQIWSELIQFNVIWILLKIEIF